jgi:hypothetical protein
VGNGIFEYRTCNEAAWEQYIEGERHELEMRRSVCLPKQLDFRCLDEKGI